MSNYFTTKRKRRKTPWQVPMWTDEKRTEYIYNSQSDLVGSRLLQKPDNDLQRIFRDIFTVVDIVAIAKTIKLCFVEETPVLQFEGGNSEPIIVASNIISDNNSDHDITTGETTLPIIPIIIVGLVTTVYCGTQIISNPNSKKSKTNENETKKKICFLKQQYNEEQSENVPQIINEQSDNRKISFFHKLVCCGFITIILFLGIYFGNSLFASRTIPAVASKQNVSVSTPQTTPKYKHTRIADIKVGERVVTSKDVTPQPTQVDPETWKKVTLYAEETWYDGTIDSINVVTLVPPEWIALHDAKVGNLIPIPLDLQEMGLDENLLAKVQAIERCPEIRAGPGRVVLTTVNHLSRGICKLTYSTLDGKSETIRPTITHRFYSLDRDEWIHIGDARSGEKLQGLGNDIITVISCQPLGTTERVYNMTVEDEHVYHVGYLNLLAHNNCPIASNFFRRVKNSHQGQNMSPYERDFVETLFKRKPNLQIYRTTDGKGLGDFLIVDMSNAKKHTGYLVELKMSSGSPQAGHQLRYYEYVPETMPKLGLTNPPEPMTGTIEEIMAKITNGHP